jgi:hypothetical protein
VALRRDWGKRRFPWLPSRSLSTSPRSTSMHSGGRSEGSCCSLSPARAMLPCCTPPPPPPHTSSNGPSLIWPTHGGGFEIMRGCIFVDSSNGGATRSPPNLPSASPRILPAPAPPATAPTSQTPSWSEVPDDPHTRSSPGIPLSLSEGIQGALPSIPSSFNRDPSLEITISKSKAVVVLLMILAESMRNENPKLKRFAASGNLQRIGRSLILPVLCPCTDAKVKSPIACALLDASPWLKSRCTNHTSTCCKAESS